jgi:hypothetical protein
MELRTAVCSKKQPNKKQKTRALKGRSSTFNPPPKKKERKRAAGGAFVVAAVLATSCF